VIAVVLLVAASAVAVVMSAAAWGLSQEFGSFDMLVLGAMPWALLPAGLVAVAVALLRGPGRSRRTSWIVLGLVWAVVVLLVSGLAVAANAGRADGAADAARGSAARTEVVGQIAVD